MRMKLNTMPCAINTQLQGKWILQIGVKGLLNRRKTAAGLTMLEGNFCL
jgi:hypothetical protein